jgi:hypothetical protein
MMRRTVQRTLKFFQDLRAEDLSGAPDFEDAAHLGLDLGRGALVGVGAAVDDDGVKGLEEHLSLANPGLLEYLWVLLAGCMEGLEQRLTICKVDQGQLLAGSRFLDSLRPDGSDLVGMASDGTISTLHIFSNVVWVSMEDRVEVEHG